MNKNKLLILTFIITSCFVLTFLFPSINSKIRIHFFSAKYFIFKPIESIGISITNYLDIFNLQKNNMRNIRNLENKITNLETINNNLLIKLSNNELNEILFNELAATPKTIGVKIIGNKNHIIEDLLIIDKGFYSGISAGDYLISKNHIIGRVKEVNSNFSEVVSIFNVDYGDEVLVGEKSFIIRGTNNNYLSFVRQKDTTEDLNLNIGDIAKIKVNNFYINIGKVEFLNSNFIIKPTSTSSYSTARVLISD